MRKKWVRVVFVALIVGTALQLKAFHVSAAVDTMQYNISGTGNVMTMTELLSKYRSSAIEVAENNTTYALESAKYDVSMELLSSMNVGDSQYPDVKLQADLYQYAKNYQGSLVESANQKLDVELVKKCYQVIVNQEQRDYYNAYAEYLNTSYYIANKKYIKGYVTQDMVDQIKADMDANATSLLENQYNRENLLLDTGMDSNAVVLPISLQDKTFCENDVLSLVRKNDMKSEELTGAIIAYQNYLTNLNLASNTVAYRKIQIQLSEYQLQLQKHEKSMETFTKKAIKSYNLVNKQCKDAKSKVDVATRQYANAQMQYTKGKIAKIDLMKVSVTKEEKELNYYNLCYQKMTWEYILENGIYGVTP